MYIDIDDPSRRTIIPFTGDRGPHKERDPWVIPMSPNPYIPYAPRPFVPKVDIPVDEEYPVSKEEIEKEEKDRENRLHEEIMKNSTRKINRGLRSGQRVFDIEDIDNRMRNKEINMLISQYKAAGWKVYESDDNSELKFI